MLTSRKSIIVHLLISNGFYDLSCWLCVCFSLVFWFYRRSSGFLFRSILFLDVFYFPRCRRIIYMAPSTRDRYHSRYGDGNWTINTLNFNCLTKKLYQDRQIQKSKKTP